MDRTEQALVAKWRTAMQQRGNVGGQGASEDEITRAEAKLGIVLPADLRLFFRAINGTADGGEDSMGGDDVAFHRVDQLRAWHDDAVSLPTGGGLYPFANVLIWSHAFAALLGPVPAGASPIYLVGWGQPRLLADSFEAFMTLYAAKREEQVGLATHRLSLMQILRRLFGGGRRSEAAR